jgi:hypothetical protein
LGFLSFTNSLLENFVKPNVSRETLETARQAALFEKSAQKLLLI